MKSSSRVLYSVGALALMTASVLGSSGPAVVRGAAATPMAMEVYLDSLLTPAQGQLVSGAVAIIGLTAGAGQAEGQANQQNKTGTTVALQVAGLKPLGSYTAVIGTQACTSTSAGSNSTGSGAPPVITVHANAGGDAMSIIASSYKVTPRAKTVLALRQGSSTGSLVACATLHMPARVVAFKGMSVSDTASGIAMITPNMPVMNGMVKSGTEVIVYATGLQRSTVQPNHLHFAACNTPSGILAPLNTLVTDATGRAIAGTGIPYNITMTGGSIHIHNTAFAMEACGNLSAGTAMNVTATPTPST